MALDSLGDLVITAGVDATGIPDGLGQARDEVKAMAAQMAGSLGTAQDATTKLGEALGDLPAAAGKAGDGLGGATEPANRFSQAAQSIIDRQSKLEAKAWDLRAALGELQHGFDAGTVSSDALQRAQDQLAAVMEKAYGKIHDIVPATEDAEGGIKGLAEQLLALGEALAITEGLKEFGAEALAAYSQVQQLSLSLEALTGSGEAAENALANIEHIAATQPFSFPELAGAAQRLTAFAGDAEQIPRILQTAADVARATGNSFDAIASALGRVELAGQVSGKQLVQLGVSWDDLAKTAGVSVGEVQELLKKGGQSAAEDLDLLLRAAEQKFAGFANVPLTIAQQWTVLQNQIHQVFAAIGEALAPVAAQIVAILQGSVIPLVKDMVESFNALPTPVKDAAVALALVVAAAAPIALAIGGFGLAMAGLQTVIPLVTAGLDRMGISFGATAVEAEALAVAETQVAANSAGVIAGGNNMAAAGSAFGSSWSLIGWSAIGTELVQLAKALEDDYEAYQKLRQALRDAGAADKGYQEALERTHTALEAATQGNIGLRNELERVYDKFVFGKMGADEFGKAMRDISNQLKDASGWEAFSAGANDFIGKAQQQADKVAALTVVVKELSENQQGDATITHALALAQKELQTATDALYGATQPLVKSEADIVAGATQANATLIAAQAVYDGIKAKYDAGAASALALADAHKQLKSAMDAASAGVLSVDGAVQSLKDKQDQLEATARNNVLAYLALAKEYEVDSPIMVNAMKDVTSSMKAAGVTLDDLTAGPKAFATEMVVNGKVVEAAAQDTATGLRAIANAMDGVDESEKKVTGHTNEQRDAWGFLKQSVVSTSGSLQDAIRYVDEMGTVMGHTAAIGQDGFNWLTGSVESLDAALQSAYGAFGALNSEVDQFQSKSSGGGGKGGRGGGISGQLGFTGTPDQMRAEYEADMRYLDSIEAFGTSSGIISSGVDDARRKAAQDLATSIANYYAMNPQARPGASSASSGGGGSASAPKAPAVPTGSQAAPTMVLYSDVTGAITSALTSAVDPGSVKDAIDSISQATVGFNDNITALADGLAGLQQVTASVASTFQASASTFLLQPDIPASWLAGADAIMAAQKSINGLLPSFQAAQAQLQTTLDTAAASPAGAALAAFARTPNAGAVANPALYTPQPLLNPIANGVVPVPNLTNVMSQVTNASSASHALSIGQIIMDKSDPDAQQLWDILSRYAQRKGIRF